MTHKSLYNVFALAFFFLAAPMRAAFPGESAPTGPPSTAPGAPATFGHIRALSLDEARALALTRAPAIAQARAKVAQAQAQERELKRRLVPQVGGGLDPFSGQVRTYLNIDFQRLFQLNKNERVKARQSVEDEQLGQVQAQQSAIAQVTSAWFALKRAEAAHTTARRNLVTAKALFASADARFRAGTGELGSVLSAMNGQANAGDSVTATRQALLLACLTLAQACGYATAEEMEPALAAGSSPTANGKARRFSFLPLEEEEEDAPDASPPAFDPAPANPGENTAPESALPGSNEEVPF